MNFYIYLRLLDRLTWRRSWANLEVFLNLPYLAAFQCNPEYQYAAAPDEGPITITQREAALLRSKIRHEIIREYRVIDPTAVRSAYEPLCDVIFSYVDPGKHCLPIFTTNYDLAIETLCETLYNKYELTEGLELECSKRQSAASPRKAPRPDPSSPAASVERN